ncbi:MAG: hypothetical protein BMS9Abin20_0287 [Acidimicrobiia bacterium]|nr:MAG: hypothetical protein BMS9Abin20_0287 [Acidimicrobiia bacterium]
MRRPTLWLIAISAIVVTIVMVARIADDGPGLAAPPTTADPASTTSTVLASTTTVVPPTTTPATLPPDATACGVYASIVDVGTVASKALVEASGLAVSRTTPGVLWSHNDSGDTARLYAFDTSGSDLGVFDLPDALAFDWEDMAAGPGPDGAGSYLYVGGIGDNYNIRRGKIAVYRVPDVDPTTMTGSFEEVVTLKYRYPDGSPNAEAILIDPIEPALYVITKAKTEAFVYKGSLTPTGEESELELVTTLFLDAEVTAADISWDGGVIALRGYRTVWMWQRAAGSSIAESLSTEPCLAPAPDELQGESIAFDRDLSYWTISEGLQPDLHVAQADV